jgi:nucleosome binding factor SPN SPT16 subunit
MGPDAEDLIVLRKQDKSTNENPNKYIEKVRLSKLKTQVKELTIMDGLARREICIPIYQNKFTINNYKNVEISNKIDAYVVIIDFTHTKSF